MQAGKPIVFYHEFQTDWLVYMGKLANKELLTKPVFFQCHSREGGNPESFVKNSK
jgi:hypothetical protein